MNPRHDKLLLLGNAILAIRPPTSKNGGPEQLRPARQQRKETTFFTWNYKAVGRISSGSSKLTP
jgi:hypothetical protein